MNVFRDLRFALRSLAKDRRLTLLATLALALGIGATTAMFSIVDNLLFEPFPYKDFKRSAVFYVHDTTADEHRSLLSRSGSSWLFRNKTASSKN
jgi:hypothetical protein